MHVLISYVRARAGGFMRARADGFMRARADGFMLAIDTLHPLNTQPADIHDVEKSMSLFLT